MANEVITPVSPLVKVESHRLVIIPNNLSGTFVADDTNNHQLKLSGQGKGRFTVAVTNLANQDLTVRVYGMHSLTGAIGDAGTYLIATLTVTTAEDQEYQTCNDPFPFYLFDLAYAVAPTDDPATTCSIFVDFSSA